MMDIMVFRDSAGTPRMVPPFIVSSWGYTFTLGNGWTTNDAANREKQARNAWIAKFGEPPDDEAERTEIDAPWQLGGKIIDVRWQALVARAVAR
jgi:hypothetical protein